MKFDIIRLAHAEFNVTDLGRARDFYINALGFFETESDTNHIYLRAIEDANHHCLILTKANVPSVNHIAYRVGSEEELDKLAAFFMAQNLPMRWIVKGEERGQGRALRIQDPGGIPVEFFFEMEKAEIMLQKFHKHSGAKIKRIDHANCNVRNIDFVNQWYTENLGFQCSEYTVTGSIEDERLWASWLHRKPSVHDLALIHEKGPRLHHIGFWMEDSKSILDACDYLASCGHYTCIERNPGRHGTSNAFFVYLRDPDGHRMELYTSDYFTGDPDWDPIKWHLSDPQRATLWGAEPPVSWKKEAMPVQNILSGELMEIGDPIVQNEGVKK